jgi:hypothetical protein
MQGMVQLAPCVPLQSRDRLVDETPLLSDFPSSSSSVALLRSTVAQKRMFSGFIG